MARPYRLQAENCFYHITSRGDGRKQIYRSSADYLRFLEYIKKAKERYRFYLYGYVLMTNHYHLLIETQEANLSRIMQYINTAYTTYYNIKRRRSGHLFQGRYKSIVVERDSYIKELSRYIHYKYKKSIQEINQKKKEASRIRKIGIYLLRRLTGLTNRDIGKIFDMRYSAVSKAGVSVEGLIKKDKKLKKEINELISIFEG